jgi:hypothetical protein
MSVASSGLLAALGHFVRIEAMTVIAGPAVVVKAVQRSRLQATAHSLTPIRHQSIRTSTLYAGDGNLRGQCSVGRVDAYREPRWYSSKQTRVCSPTARLGLASWYPDSSQCYQNDRRNGTRHTLSMTSKMARATNIGADGGLEPQPPVYKS